MDWVTPRDDPADNLLSDFQRPPQHQQVPDFSPLVNGLLATPAAPTVAGEWPVPRVTRTSRNDFRYEFSLSAGPEFDTDSADAHAPRDPRDEDDASTDIHGAATSEDTSVGPDPAAPNKPFPPTPHDASSLPTDPRASVDAFVTPTPLPDPGKKEATLEADQPHPDPAQPDPADSALASPAKPAKTILKKKTAAKKPVRTVTMAPNPSASLSAGTSAVVGALSHTKMCRDRLNNMFERLRHTLPPAPSGVEVKHKAQVLDYAIAVLKSMVDRTSQLEVELAVSSNKATMDWISKLVNKVDTFPDASEEVMRLFSRRRGWKHAELWVAGKRPVKPDSDPEECVVLTFCRSVVNEAMGMGSASLEQFSKESESYAFRAKEGVQGRVWSSMRPEWVTGLSELKNFRRAALARKYGLKVCLAVPVTITGKIEAVMCFYDTKHRPYDTQCLELGMRLAWALGNAVGGKRAKVNVLTASGTSNT